MNRLELDAGTPNWGDNRFVTVLRVAARHKARARELVRPSLAAEFYRENPMPWLLDAEPVEGPSARP